MLGFLNIAKPEGITSHDVVDQVRKILQCKRVGHGGTLDPLAQGVLPIAIGSACRFIRFLPTDKVYLAQIQLGHKTTTDDREGKTISLINDFTYPTADELASALSLFIGEIEQRPPLYSAVHHNGARLYELARRGQAPEQLKTRAVVVHGIEIMEIALPLLTLRITCGSGTYIRSIARDLGDHLGMGACLQALTRERAGPFSLAAAVSLKDRPAKECLEADIIPIEAILLSNPNIAFLPVDNSTANLLSMGQRVDTAGLHRYEIKDGFDINFVLTSYEDSFMALCRLNEKLQLEPEIVIADGK